MAVVGCFVVSQRFDSDFYEQGHHLAERGRHWYRRHDPWRNLFGLRPATTPAQAGPALVRLVPVVDDGPLGAVDYTGKVCVCVCPVPTWPATRSRCPQACRPS